LECGSDVPGQKLSDAIDRMVRDARQDGAKVKRGIESAELGCANEGVERSCALTAGIGTEKQVILSSNRDRPERPLGGAIIDFQQTIIDIARDARQWASAYRIAPAVSLLAERDRSIFSIH
jgi:hypothetical protein